MWAMITSFFDSLDVLEPHCRKCNAKIEYGVTTIYDESKEAHICVKCGCLLK
jgi:hypothetical protein